MCNIRPIRTEAEYTAALARVSDLAHAGPGTPEGDERDLLADLAELYEYRNIPMPPVQGPAAIWSLIDRQGVTVDDLNTEFTGDGDIVAALDGKEELTGEMAKALQRQLGVPAEELLRMAVTPIF